MEMIISQLKSPQEWYQVCRRAAGYGLTNKGDFLNLQSRPATGMVRSHIQAKHGPSVPVAATLESFNRKDIHYHSKFSIKDKNRFRLFG